MDCPCAPTPLTVGHDYYLYGSQMQTYSPVDKFASTWQGQVSAPSGHSVGDTLTSVAGAGSGPGAYSSGGSYFLLPVIDPSSAVVEYYSVFRPVAGHPNWGQLVDNIPVQAIPSTFLIGPDGHILAKGLRGDALKEAVARALKADDESKGRPR